eukprot:TRINITY_DN5967_c0_g1_i1.p1 TRINITY_DN5967_c0_g1~~TRINITY_DN5967_c0_g1_i1.p1  ORF type:complete len:484 (-),score=25.70 TRINITY_DN5967_c0_g1_i1:69-1520(-)
MELDGEQNIMQLSSPEVPPHTSALAKLIKERCVEALGGECIYLGPRDLSSLSTDDWCFACNTIRNSTIVETLYIEFMFRKEWCFLLAETLKENQSITELDLGSVKPNSCKYFAELLKVNKTIKKLNFLDGSSIEDKGLCFISEVLENHNRTLTTLILQGNQIENEGCIRLCNALKKNTSVTSLDLSYNMLEYDAWKSIGDMLKNNSTLKVLGLIESGYKSEDGCVALVEGLKQNSTLTHLNILRNSFDRNSTNALIDLVASNKSITSLSMASDLFEDPQISIQLQEALISNTTIRSLNMSLCPIKSNGASALREVLKKNRTLTQLDLQHNQLGSFGLSKIIEGLYEDDTLTRLNIIDNDITSHESLIDLLQINNSLNKIEFSTTAIDEKNSVKAVIEKYIQKNRRRQHRLNLNMILAVWNVARRSESLDLFPFEIWLHIFKFVIVPGYEKNSYATILEQLFTIQSNNFQRVLQTIKNLTRRYF